MDFTGNLNVFVVNLMQFRMPKVSVKCQEGSPLQCIGGGQCSSQKTNKQNKETSKQNRKLNVLFGMPIVSVNSQEGASFKGANAVCRQQTNKHPERERERERGKNYVYI